MLMAVYSFFNLQLTAVGRCFVSEPEHKIVGGNEQEKNRTCELVVHLRCPAHNPTFRFEEMTSF